MTFLCGKQCYFSAPIQFSPSHHWKVEPLRILREEFGLNVYDPAEDPKQQWLPVLLEAQNNKDYDKIATIAADFVKKDLSMVDRTDILIAVLPYKICSTGVHHEIIHSTHLKKPTILICTNGKEKIPLWYFGFIPHEMMFGNWENLYEHLRQVNKGEYQHNRRWRLIYDLI